MKSMAEHGGEPKMGPQAKAFVALLAVIGIVIPILLTYVMINGSFALPSTTSTTPDYAALAPFMAILVVVAVIVGVATYATSRKSRGS